MADLGNLSGFFNTSSVADLDWLDVSEEDYRALDKLPKQNLDFAPDLEAAWAHQDKPMAAYLVPNKDGAPRTMLDVGQMGEKAKTAALNLVAKVARFALMQSTDTAVFKRTLTARFDLDTLRSARNVLATVLAERGLIGKWYIDGRDFHACGKFPKASAEFVRRHASSARYILACQDCPSCLEKVGTTCAVFQKKIVVEVPYTTELAQRVEQTQSASGKAVQASSASPKDRIRAAMLAEASAFQTVSTPKPVVNPAQFLQTVKSAGKVHLPVIQTTDAQLIEASFAWSANAAVGKTASSKNATDKKAFEVVKLLSREMLRGRSEGELIQALKLSFTTEELQSTRSTWAPLFKEAGLYGTLYSTQTSFDSCSEGVDFLSKHNSTIRAIVAGGKCDSCFYNKMGRCLSYGKKLVASSAELYTPETVAAVVRQNRTAGKLETGADKVAWGETPREALKNIYRVASAPAPQTANVRSHVERMFSGKSHETVTAASTKVSIVKSASQFMNEGLYGKDLSEALHRRFTAEDLKASKEELRSVLAEQGLQGIYYIDPSVYADYGHGCAEPERLFRARLIEYVKIGSACTSCVHQSKVGFCSKINKPLTKEPPYADKRAQQREILASGKSTEIDYNNLVNNGRSMLAEFGMESQMTFDLEPEKVASAQVEVEIGRAKVKL